MQGHPLKFLPRTSLILRRRLFDAKIESAQFSISGHCGFIKALKYTLTDFALALQKLKKSLRGLDVLYFMPSFKNYRTVRLFLIIKL